MPMTASQIQNSIDGDRFFDDMAQALKVEKRRLKWLGLLNQSQPALFGSGSAGFMRKVSAFRFGRQAMATTQTT